MTTLLVVSGSQIVWLQATEMAIARHDGDTLKVRWQAGWVWLALMLLSRIPWHVADLLGRFIGWVNYRQGTRSCKVTRVNLELCLPELTADEREALTLASLQESATTALETPRVWMRPWQNTNRVVSCVEGEELLKQAIQSGKGLIILLPHLSNWEIYNVFIREYGEMTALYLPSRKAYLARVMTRVRGRHGNEMVPANRAGVTTLFRRLQAGKIVSILPDQVPASGEYVPFFGVQALTDPLASRLLARTGAEVLSLHIIRCRKPFGFNVHIRTLPEGIHSQDTRTSLEALNQAMESCVREAVSQYQWDYKRFRERPGGEKKVYRFDRPEAFH